MSDFIDTGVADTLAASVTMVAPLGGTDTVTVVWSTRPVVCPGMDSYDRHHLVLRYGDEMPPLDFVNGVYGVPIRECWCGELFDVPAEVVTSDETVGEVAERVAGEVMREYDAEVARRRDELTVMLEAARDDIVAGRLDPASLGEPAQPCEVGIYDGELSAFADDPSGEGDPIDVSLPLSE